MVKKIAREVQRVFGLLKHKVKGRGEVKASPSKDFRPSEGELVVDPEMGLCEVKSVGKFINVMPVGISEHHSKGCPANVGVRYATEDEVSEEK